MNDSTLRRRGFTFWQVVLVLATLALLTAILFPLFGRPRGTEHRPVCQSYLKQIMLGVKQYAQDYDERFPPAVAGVKANSNKANDLSAFGWADALYPYLKSRTIYQCPQEPNLSNAPYSGNVNPTQPQYTDYWFNARLSRLSQKHLLEPARTISLGDGNDGTDATNARYHLMSLATNWRKDEKSPLYRHLEGANFAFADGHVKWLKGSGWDDGVSQRNGATLLPGSGK